MLGLDRESSLWLSFYFPVSWAVQFGHGLVTTVVGPTQPYLARNTNVAIDKVNFVWTFGFLGFLVGSLVTGFVFKQYLKSARSKLIFLFATICGQAIFVIVLPFTSSFAVLVTGRLIQHFALGANVTADASLIVYLLGPEKSRPFTMALHALIGAGFLAATFLVRPFLPTEGEVDKQSLCNRNETIETVVGNVSTHTVGQPNQLEDYSAAAEAMAVGAIPDLAWPFIISGSWCIICSFGFLVLACLPYKMPRFYESDEDTASAEGEAAGSEPRTQIKSINLFYIIIFLYFFVTCGVERIYQPMASTFGLCGPLDLTPEAAVATDSFYNGGFMCGRIVSAFIAGLVSPRNMILASLSCCVLASVLLCCVAGSSVYGLYSGTCILGFFLSWQFGSCFSWVAKHINVTGRVSSLFFIGCGAGSLATPPLSGYIFTSSLGPMAIIYLTLVFCLVQCLLYLSLWLLARSKNSLPPSHYSLCKMETK